MTQHEVKNRRFLVVGLGAIGGILACHLKSAGYATYAVDANKDYIDAVREKGIKLEGLTSCMAHLDQVCSRFEDLEIKEFDYVIISVKTPYLPDVVATLRMNLDDNFKVVAMQNGIDNEEYLARFFGKDRSMRAVVNFAGNILEPGLIDMTFFHKPNIAGCLCGEEECEYAIDLSQCMTGAGLETEPSTEISKYTWRKTILVAALAPIAATLGMTMAEVMSTGETRSLVVKLLREAIAVAKAYGYDYGETFFDFSLDYLSTAGHHKPSMLIDIENGSPTEIEYINGKIAYHGHLLNIPVPLNTSITSMVKAKERLEMDRKKKNAVTKNSN
jgi:2-dehydropantoate 2-reductase